MKFYLSVLLAILLSSCLFSQSIDLISPSDNYQTSEDSLSFSFQYNSSGSYFDSASCSIILDGSTVISNMVLTNNQTYILTIISVRNSDLFSYVFGVHNWHVQCDLHNSLLNETLYDAILSDTYQFEITPISAQIQLISPKNDFTSQSNENTFKFLYSPKDTGSQNPLCYLDVGVSRVAQEFANADLPTSIRAILNAGTHTWKITCISDDGSQIQSSLYTLHVSLPIVHSKISSGGGEVSNPYHKEIIEPKQITKSFANNPNPKTNNSTNSSLQNSNDSALNSIFISANIFAPKYVVEGDVITILITNSSNQPIRNEFVQIIDSHNQIIYALSDSNGSASFIANSSGVYLYKLVSFKLNSIPSTIVEKKYLPKTQDTLTQSIENSQTLNVLSSDVNPDSFVNLSSTPSLFWANISVFFIVASFLLLAKFSSD